MIQTTLALLVLALPPQVEITGKGTKIIQGQITITVLPDGSVLVKSPSANLVLPAADAEPVVPPADDLADVAGHGIAQDDAGGGIGGRGLGRAGVHAADSRSPPGPRPGRRQADPSGVSRS